MNQPFGWLPERPRRVALLATSAVALALMGLLVGLGAPLETAEAPLGIVSFELAGSAERARSILDSWSTDARLRAALVQGLDALFLVVYPAAIALACAAVASNARRWPLVVSVGLALAWAQLLAAALDAVENVALIRVLLGADGDGWPILARACALPKFAIVAAGLLYVLIGAGIGAADRLRGRA